jgi:hypothetical protein
VTCVWAADPARDDVAGGYVLVADPSRDRRDDAAPLHVQTRGFDGGFGGRQSRLGLIELSGGRVELEDRSSFSRNPFNAIVFKLGQTELRRPTRFLRDAGLEFRLKWTHIDFHQYVPCLDDSPRLKRHRHDLTAHARTHLGGFDGGDSSGEFRVVSDLALYWVADADGRRRGRHRLCRLLAARRGQRAADKQRDGERESPPEASGRFCGWTGARSQHNDIDGRAVSVQVGFMGAPFNFGCGGTYFIWHARFGYIQFKNLGISASSSKSIPMPQCHVDSPSKR